MGLSKRASERAVCDVFEKERKSCGLGGEQCFAFFGLICRSMLVWFLVFFLRRCVRGELACGGGDYEQCFLDLLALFFFFFCFCFGPLFGSFCFNAYISR